MLNILLTFVVAFMASFGFGGGSKKNLPQIKNTSIIVMAFALLAVQPVEAVKFSTINFFTITNHCGAPLYQMLCWDSEKSCDPIGEIPADGQNWHTHGVPLSDSTQGGFSFKISWDTDFRSNIYQVEGTLQQETGHLWYDLSHEDGSPFLDKWRILTFDNNPACAPMWMGPGDASLEWPHQGGCLNAYATTWVLSLC